VSGLRILLVDNLIAYRQKTKGWIVEAGARAEDVLEAGTGAEALEVIAHHNYDVDIVVCEWDDENVNAEELVHQLRNNLSATQIGFVALCGNDPGAIRAAKGAGVSEVVVKPVTPVELLKALSLARRQLKPRSDKTRQRLQQAASVRTKSKGLSSTIAAGLRAAGKLGKYKLGSVIATGNYLDRLYWIESGTVFVRETRGDGTTLEYRVTPGRFFGEAAFAGETIVTLRAVNESEAIVGWQEKEAVLQTMQKLPILSHYFKTITADRYRNNVVVELPDEGIAGGLNGTLESLPFPDVMQMMVVSKKTGVLRIDSGGESALLHIACGVLRHAELGPRTGEEVVYRVVSWAGGRFAFAPRPAVEGPVTIQKDANFLLMEGMRRRDAGSK